jgi:hypothetical protein
MIPSLLDGWQATQATTPLDLVPDTSGTAIMADRYVPLATNAVGDWIEYLHPLPQDVNEVYNRIREIELRQRMEPIVFDDSQFDGDRQEWLQEFLEPFEVEEIQPFTDEELSELLFGDG